MSLLFRSAEAMAADEIGYYAYGDDPTPEAPHAEHLRALSRRLGLFSGAYAFSSPQDYPFSIPAVVREIAYMADGEAPIALKRALRDANASATPRKVRHWARALEWVEFLNRSNKRITDCRAVVADAYGVGIDSIGKDWRPKVEEILGISAVQRIERAKTKTLGDMHFETQEEGLAALKADGAAYQAYLKEQAAAVHSIRGNRNA